MNELEWFDLPDDVEWLEFPVEQDFYRTLNVHRSATQEDIRRSYIVLVSQYHPDRHPDSRRLWAEEMTKLLNRAYAVLSKEALRREYDARLQTL